PVVGGGAGGRPGLCELRRLSAGWSPPGRPRRAACGIAEALGFTAFTRPYAPAAPANPDSAPPAASCTLIDPPAPPPAAHAPPPASAPPAPRRIRTCARPCRPAG